MVKIFLAGETGRIADCFRVDCYPVKTCRLDIMGLLPRLPSIVGRGLFSQAGLGLDHAGEGGKRDWRGINGNLPHGPLLGAKMTGAGRSRSEFPADLR